MIMTPEEWAERARGLFDVVEETGYTLDDLPGTFIWKQPLMNMPDAINYEHLQVPAYNGLLFTGPAGNGKHTLMRAYIQSLCRKEMSFENTVFVRLRTEDFSEEVLPSNEDVAAFVDGLFLVGENTGEMGILVFDQMDSYDRLPVVCNMIADNHSSGSYPSVHVICIAEDEDNINSELASVLLSCRCNSPTAKEREQYLQENLSWDVPDWETNEKLLKTAAIGVDGWTVEKIAEKTEGFSFAELAALVQYMKMEIAGRSTGSLSTLQYKVDEDMAEAFINLARRQKKASGGAVVYQAGFAGAAAMMAAAAPVSAEDVRKNRAKELTSKNDSERTVEENMELIDLVPTIAESEAKDRQLLTN